MPKKWLYVRLEELTENPKQDIVDGPFGSNLKATEYVDIGMPIVRLQNIERNCFLEKNIRCVTPVKAEELSRHSFRSGDVIITKLGNPVGKACIVPSSLPQGIIVADVVRARIAENLAVKEFVTYAINSPNVISQINLEVKGSTRPRVNLSHIRSLEIPLPPLSEQRRIVVKLEELLGKVDACQTRLTKIPVILKRFRQAVLAAACSGRLTADWREKNCIDDEWPVFKLAEIGAVTGGVTKNAKRQTMNLQVPYLRVANVYENRLDLREVLCIGITDQEFKRTHLLKGDLLFVEGNGSIDQIGRVALWNGSIEPCVHQNHLIKFRAGNSVKSAYVLLQMMAPKGRAQLIEKATSTAGLHTLSISKISEVHLPVPPLSEQQEIVRRIEVLFTLANQLEDRYQKAKAQVARLTQSILAKAFRGELVPQDENDVPASVLLERTRSQRVESLPAKRSAGSKRQQKQN